MKRAKRARRKSTRPKIRPIDPTIPLHEIEQAVEAALKSRLPDTIVLVVQNMLRREVEDAMAALRTAFRDGPVLINENLSRLSKEILVEEIERAVERALRKETSDANGQSDGDVAATEKTAPDDKPDRG